MTELAIGQPVPDFTLQATAGRVFSSAGLQGKYWVVYFYPKDSTPGFTQ